MEDNSMNEISDIENQNISNSLTCAFSEMRQQHIDNINMKIIDKSLELVDISNVSQTLKKKLN